MKAFIGKAKWTTTNHTKDRSSSQKGDVVYMEGLEGSPLLWAPSGKCKINSNNYCSKLDPLKAVLNEKHPELVNRKLIIFHQNKTRPHVSLMTRQNCYSFAVVLKFWFICCITGIAPLDFLYFVLYKILFMKKIQFPRSP